MLRGALSLSTKLKNWINEVLSDRMSANSGVGVGGQNRSLVLA